MIAFWKENSKTITKLWLYQFAAAFMGIILFNVSVSLATGFTITFTVFTLLFYLSLIYMAMWELGANDKIKIDGGRLKYVPLKGLFVSLFANVPNFIIFIFVVVGYVFGSGLGWLNQNWANYLGWASEKVAFVWESMFNGVFYLYTSIKPIQTPLYYLLIILPALLVCLVGYYLGVKNVKLVVGKILTSKKEKKNRGSE